MSILHTSLSVHYTAGSSFSFILNFRVEDFASDKIKGKGGVKSSNERDNIHDNRGPNIIRPKRKYSESTVKVVVGEF